MDPCPPQKGAKKKPKLVIPLHVKLFSAVLSGATHHTLDSSHKTLPTLFLLAQGLLPRSGKPVVLGPAVVSGGPPARGEEASLFKPVQSRVEGALRDLEDLLGKMGLLQ